MERETKYCITTIIIAAIWLLGQPMSGNVSVEANFDRLPYFNLTNSTVSGSAEISGSIPIGIIIMMSITEIISKIPMLVIGGIVTAALATYIFYITGRK